MVPLDAEISQQILDSLPMGIYVVTLDRHILFWNKAAERITGYRAQDVGDSVGGDEVLMHAEQRAMPVCSTAERLLEAASGNASPEEVALFARHKDGHHLAVRVRSVPLRGGNGSIVAIAEVFVPKEEKALPRPAPRNAVADPDDALGIPPTEDSERYLQSKLKQPGTLGVFVAEMAGIQDMARQRGLQMVHACERALVHHWGVLLPMPHFLGHWHDQSFLIVVPNPSVTEFENLRTQLNGPDGQITIVWWGDRFTPSLSVRGAIVNDHEALQRLIANGARAQVGAS